MGRAHRSGRTFHLVVVVPDTLKHADDLRELGREYPMRVINWAEIAAIARQTATAATRPIPAGHSFLVAYADFIERKVLNWWEGVQHVGSTPQVVNAASTYIVARAALLTQMRRFCDAVHDGVQLPVPLAPKERTEKDEDGWIALFRYRYDLPDWRTHVAVTFYTWVGAKSLRSVELEVDFCSWDDVAITKSRRRGLRNRTDAKKRFGSKANSDFGERIWVAETIPRKLWLTNNAKLSEKAVTYTQKVLGRFLREAHRLVK